MISNQRRWQWLEQGRANGTTRLSTGGQEEPVEPAEHRAPQQLAPAATARARAEASPIPQGLGPWRGRCSRGVERLIPSMASDSLCCPIRQVVVHFYPGSNKAVCEPRLTLHFGRRGRPVQKPRLLPLRTAMAVARKLQARHIGTASVL